MQDRLENRFKFRLWDKCISQMSYDVCVGFIKDGGRRDWVCADICDGQINYCEKRLNDIVLMQCTGLKDKNGKLIYEGDVVRFEETYECACFTSVEVILFEIIWRDYGFMAKQIKIIKGNESYEFPLTLPELLEIEPYTEQQTTITLEVIGNKFENPELLKECEDE